MGSVFSSARFAANTVNEAALRRSNFSAIEFQRQFIGASEICISLNAITAPAHLHSSSLLLAHVYSDNKWKLLPMSMREQRQMRVINIRPYIHHAQHKRSLPPGPESSFLCRAGRLNDMKNNHVNEKEEAKHRSLKLP